MPETPPKAYLRRMPGGAHPEIGELFRETFQDFQDHLGDYVLASLGFYLVSIVVVVGALFIGYIGFFMVSVVGVILARMVIVAFQGTLGDHAADLLALPVNLSVMVLLLVFAGGFGAAISAILAPIGASLNRAVAKHQRGEARLTVSAPFDTMFERPGSVITTGIAMTFLSLIGVVFCYVPALLVPLAFGFAGTLAALHPVGGMRAMALSFRHARAYPSWAFLMAVVTFVVAMVAGNIPILGGAFAVAFHVRAHRYVFGDGEEPTLSEDGSSSGETNTQ